MLPETEESDKTFRTGGDAWVKLSMCRLDFTCDDMDDETDDA